MSQKDIMDNGVLLPCNSARPVLTCQTRMDFGDEFMSIIMYDKGRYHT